jgi:hypothetical protein
VQNPLRVNAQRLWARHLASGLNASISRGTGLLARGISRLNPCKGWGRLPRLDNYKPPGNDWVYIVECSSECCDNAEVGDSEVEAAQLWNGANPIRVETCRSLNPAVCLEPESLVYGTTSPGKFLCSRGAVFPGIGVKISPFFGDLVPFETAFQTFGRRR